MRRKNCYIVGNFLMGLGLITMIGGIGYCVIVEISQQWDLPMFLSHGAIISLFFGALLWLAGARMSGCESIAERYWWIKHFAKHNKLLSTKK